ncbi:acyl-CoA dehydrogenase [Marinobacter lutaoensis]|jgi:acyl-CoA dehydrogenase|uniref:Acyl-coenzyme A dehydrogenase n=1 Tax=Marinobacter lutaoensis TaxID=135739 RepID=A0A1V2DSU1_9GAMM|nr:acyl-CoA dehydrogenase [Marinobacter lutaoensis]NVD35847.1 acyl-CoA dehydrogenase [Marinobacter lutaoensis]ONF43530.1 acyl-CoA dehydrogenase [Marinobacter lutaoensis]|tara:strand:+ start:4986 stop:7436 length:2451 start_codon:yes stop_codon:yes gene_type:complete
MITLLLFLVALAGLLVVMRREAGAKPAIGVMVVVGLLSCVLASGWLALLLFAGAAVTAAAGLPGFRRSWLTPKIFAVFKQVAPKVSDTEKVALEAGTVGWDGELFTGRPDWHSLLVNRHTGLTDEEQAFLDNQCTQAIALCNAWDLAVERADLPGELWEFLKKEKFFGMIIPKEYGGLGFSAKAQTAVLQKLAANEMLMVTVGVPNSLGPGELLVKYGTEAQKQHYLPRLADGREIPCFGLTGPRAGSDATSLPDKGIVCKQTVDGKEVLGIRLNFEKRWITLAPVATVVGLAFRLFDPDGLLGDKEDYGITCALIPRDTPGMEIGRRHCPVGSPFMNGPIRGKDVFIPLDYIIGGIDMAGQGWRMLVECLSVGRCITLPSGAAGISAFALGTAGGFTRIRRQFNTPVADLEGVQEPLARIAARTYIAQASVNHTANMIDHGQKPAVPSAILKYHLTEFQRAVLNDAMDVHGGKTVTLGPRNYLALSYSGAAVSITVEGANIMTRSLMIFGQGAIRCHPYVLAELAAKDNDDLRAFDKAFFGHAGLIFGNAARAFTQALGLGRAEVPFDSASRRYAQAVSRFSAAFGLCADAAMTTLGSELKMRELISARLGDMLANLYLASMVLKHWYETQPVEGERALMDYSLTLLLHRTETALLEFLENLPNRPVALVLRAITLPLGRRWPAPGDELTRTLARLVSTDSALRHKLLAGAWTTQEDGGVDNPVARYNALLRDYDKAEQLYRKATRAYAKGELPATALHPEERFEAALAAGVFTQEEADFMREYERSVLDMLTVDDFPFDAFARNRDTLIDHNAA